MAAAVVLTVVIGTASAAPAPTPAALDLVRGMNATNVGVDPIGNFWVWDSRDLFVTSISPRGEATTVDLDPDVQSINVDSRRGILTLARDGMSVRITSFSGAVTARIDLPFLAVRLCWMNGDQIAIAPAMTRWRVEVWSTSNKKPLRTLGPVPEIKAPAAGAVLTRATLLRYDRERDQLVTFDASRGELLVFDRDGNTVRRAEIRSPRFASNLEWLKELDASSKRNGESKTPTLWSYARMSLSPDGTVWLGEKSDDTSSIVTIVKILPDGTVRRTPISVPGCPASRFELWGNYLVFFRSFRSSRECIAIKKMEP
jgi:hypothetical protein